MYFLAKRWLSRSLAVLALAMTATALAGHRQASADSCPSSGSTINTCASMTVSDTSIEVGESVTFTVTVVHRSSGAPVNIGQFRFRGLWGNTTSAFDAYVNLDTNGQATYTYTATQANTQALFTNFSYYNASFSSGLSSAYAYDSPSVTVSERTTTTALALSATSIVFGSSVNATATVTPSNSTALGSAEFFAGGVSQGSTTLASGAATRALSGLAVGSHSITANFTGDDGFADSTSAATTLTVTKATPVATLALSKTSARAGEDVVLTATVTGVSTPTGTVTFRDGSRVLGTATLSSGRASFTAANLAVGARSFTATYNGSANFLTDASPARALTVAKQPSSTDLDAVKNPTTANKASVKVTVEAAEVTPTGKVVVKEGTKPRGSGTLALSRMTDLAVGRTHGCVLWSDGGVSCWGRIGDRHLGARPVAMAGLGSDAVDIAASAGGVCARSASGTIACSGSAGPARAALSGKAPDLSLVARSGAAVCRILPEEGRIVCAADAGPGSPLAVVRATETIKLKGLDKGKNKLAAEYDGDGSVLPSDSGKLILTIK